MIIDCPYCGSRDYTEFTYGRDATASRPDSDEASLDDWCAYVYDRDNPMGPHIEYWQHTRGCRQWLRMRRDTLSGKIEQIELVGPFAKAGNASTESA